MFILLSSKDLPQTGPFKAYIGNLKFEVTEADLVRFFSTKGAKPTAVNIIKDQDGRLKGYGYVEFATVLDLKKGLDLNGEVCCFCSMNAPHSQLISLHRPCLSAP